MRTWAVAATAAAILITATPAAADWQWTRWGMSPAEVVTASGSRAKPTTANLWTVDGPYIVGRVEFRSVEFGFDAGHLFMVTLNADISWFDVADASLAQSFGQAVTIQDGGRRKVYADKASGNAITINQWAGGGSMSITYRPLATGF